MFKHYKHSVISIMHITYFFRFLLLSTSNVKMSEGTFCRVVVQLRVNQVPVVQSIVSLTISLKHKFVKQISAKVTNTLLFFVEKM